MEVLCDWRLQVGMVCEIMIWISELSQLDLPTRGLLGQPRGKARPDDGVGFLCLQDSRHVSSYNLLALT